MPHSVSTLSPLLSPETTGGSADFAVVLGFLSSPYILSVQPVLEGAAREDTHRSRESELNL